MFAFTPLLSFFSPSTFRLCTDWLPFFCCLFCGLPPAGVEHLLRNVKDATISTLASDVSAKLQALKGLKGRLADVQEYLGAVLEGRLPVNNDIMTYLQVSMGGHALASCSGASRR
jgi:hypothetical protein